MCRKVVRILSKSISILLFLLLSSSTQVSSDGGVAKVPPGDAVVPLSSSNFDTHIGQYELVFLNFYADWCRFSQMLEPVFKEAATKVLSECKEPNKVLFGKVDCDQETSIAAKYHITKYPTLKVVRNGQVVKREYRGQRSVDALKDYVLGLLKDQVKELEAGNEHAHIEEKKPGLVAYLSSKEHTFYDTFRKVASDLRDDCNFYFVPRPVLDGNITHPETIHFKPSRTKFGDNHETFSNTLATFDELKKWASEKCVPLVREITFENAEELTEEGLPFLIHFHHPDDKESVDQFTKAVHDQLQNDKHSINPLIADGVKFAHPLHHLGKSVKDLPLIAIDSFRHMYLFSDVKDLKTPGKLKAFVDDLYSGKLHREFHYGPDQPTVESKAAPQSTDPPESSFKNLAPSRNRYTLLRDEL
ncbi:endoplasmic reticulum resident protein 44 [Ixodes scapularis]|nr:endoplasmic reticulum resident protein 44 [Ixodes scapularis]